MNHPLTIHESRNVLITLAMWAALAALMVQIAVWPQIQAVRNISSIMDVKIYRDGSVGTGDVLEKQFDVHIRRDTFGSVAEFTK